MADTGHFTHTEEYYDDDVDEDGNHESLPPPTGAYGIANTIGTEEHDDVVPVSNVGRVLVAAKKISQKGKKEAATQRALE